MVLFRINIVTSQAGNENLTHQFSSNFTVQTQLQDLTIPVQQPVLCRVLNAESSSCVEFVSAAAFSVSCCVRVETMGYDVNTFENG